MSKQKPQMREVVSSEPKPVMHESVVPDDYVIPSNEESTIASVNRSKVKKKRS